LYRKITKAEPLHAKSENLGTFGVETEKKKLKAKAEVKNYQRFLDAIEEPKDKLE